MAFILHFLLHSLCFTSFPNSKETKRAKERKGGKQDSCAERPFYLADKALLKVTSQAIYEKVVTLTLVPIYSSQLDFSLGLI